MSRNNKESPSAVVSFPRNRFASPGAQRVTLTGIMAVTDDFERIRILLLDRSPNGRPNTAWVTLREAVPRLSEDYSTPYEASQSTDVKCTAWFVSPPHRRAHFLETAAAMRGQWVRVEATVRPFVITRHGKTRRGASLDLASIDPAQFE